MGVLNDILNDCLDTAVQKTGQGAAEIAAGIFGGSWFVQYGAGQQPIEPNRAQEQVPEAPVIEQPAVQEIQQEHGGRSM